MPEKAIPRVMLAGTGSGCGKTTVACAVLGALKGRGLSVRAFKCGPDFIDPMFHSRVLGVSSRNLDSFLCGENTVRYLLSRGAGPDGIAVLEGVMGFYDGLSGTGTVASSHHVAQITGTPVVLVVNCRGKSLSVAAEVQGYRQFLPNTIAGIILNGVGERAWPMYRSILSDHCGLPVLGYLPHIPQAELRSRHLGLVTAAEVEDLQERMRLLAERAAETVDLKALLALAREAPPLRVDQPELPDPSPPFRLAVARDKAFCFYYRDSLELLESLGAEIIPFSPLEEEGLPPGIGGLYLGGGYPELYARELSRNRRMMDSIRGAVAGGMPTLAECGGFMLLCGELVTAGGESYPMAGVLPGSVRMGERLTRFGYQILTARRDNLLCGAGESIPAHEFHYSDADDPGGDFMARKPDGSRSWRCIHATDTLFAGYPHLHLWGNPRFAGRFARRCAEFQRTAPRRSFRSK